MRHSVLYSDPLFYAGWPANHGAWQWGDEFLCGFMRGPFKRKAMHNIGEPFERILARSENGGETWRIETPNVDFEGLSPTETAPPFSLSDSIIRVCGVYDHGGDFADERGSFYLSRDRGRSWDGPYLFGLDIPDGYLATGRTCVLERTVFLSLGLREMWGTDSTYCVWHDGERFRRLGTVCEDEARAVMPAAARSGGAIVVALRRRKSGTREGWIDAFISKDEGRSWTFLAKIGITGGQNGNPPALIALPDGRLLCAFGNRDHGSIVGVAFDTAGNLSPAFLIRPGSTDFRDIGYPRLFMRSDGVPVCVYYWSDDQRPVQHIAATAVEEIP